jgi:hypothetical protein
MKMPNIASIYLCIVLVIACSPKEQDQSNENMSWNIVQDTTSRIHSIIGLSGPESVRYDSIQDVYFVSNFNGNGSAIDSNGFISKISPEGIIDSLHFMTGTEAHPMHSPSGMYITGDTLWACDRDGVHGFDRKTGKQLQFIDFTSYSPGFLNDIVEGSDGNLYVTDTGAPRLFRISGTQVTVVQDSLPVAPNGIAREPQNGNLVLAPWGGARTFYAWNPNSPGVEKYRTANEGGFFDGIEFYTGKLLASSQQDSTLRVIDGDDHIIIKLPGEPADIGIDTKRRQVVIPYISRNTVDLWQLPEQ